ncbi:uncharacterized protein BXZ73DRAFT_99040 [Epithele typhae]|uniref:uncharacterized protein n=1 Tax=Epithele typhae TaxID=378194 RepID=UPI0020073DDC|nr:uncharacterized protein BXZ73DRAFT_99040 [Epithele typhae]KAH9940045.1 hypothetical protein BXZ73DRAFT_99040 [Epithele typhae]
MPSPTHPPRRPASAAPLPERNDVLMTRELLLGALHDLSLRLQGLFPSTVRLVVHGGAVMVLHPQLASRDATRDVDYLHRAFEAEWRARGVMDAGARLLTAIKGTARAYKLGRDWMNAAADVALPMSFDAHGKKYDPIFADAASAQNTAVNTLFTSPGLVLVGVSWAWSVALKLVRYEKHDPHDIASILRLGHRQRNVRWTRTLLENWLLGLCAPMGYAAYDPWQMENARQRMRHAIQLAYAEDGRAAPTQQRPMYVH